MQFQPNNEKEDQQNDQTSVTGDEDEENVRDFCRVNNIPQELERSDDEGRDFSGQCYELPVNSIDSNLKIEPTPESNDDSEVEVTQAVEVQLVPSLPAPHSHTFYNHEMRTKSECGHSDDQANGDRKPGGTFQPRRIMCSHCVLVDDFWLNNSRTTYNTKINKKYRYNLK